MKNPKIFTACALVAAALAIAELQIMAREIYGKSSKPH